MQQRRYKELMDMVDEIMSSSPNEPAGNRPAPIVHIHGNCTVTMIYGNVTNLTIDKDHKAHELRVITGGNMHPSRGGN